MPRLARALAFILVVALALPALVLAPAAGAVACSAGLERMEGVGLVCRRPDGLYDVFDAQMRPLGTVHGTDPAPAPGAESGLGAAGTGQVECVDGAPGTYFIQVIYARASDDADRYASMVSSVRTLVANANALVDDAGIATGNRASLRVKCVGGAVEVKNEVLPTLAATADFSTIVGDLRDKGYEDGRVKYWVFYDDTGACSCGGTGHIYGDDRLSVANWNNGNGGPMFAVTFGYVSTRIMLHELGHNLGAVQGSAPHTSGAGHCIDGHDTMCYNDGGWNARNYSTNACAIEIWDCGNDDYFHTAPPTGSYLATHWNLGSQLNRFLRFETATNVPPVMAALTCTPSEVEAGGTATCAFRATDEDSWGVRYTIDWGDGTTSVVPASGYASPGAAQSAPHTWADAGAMTVVVTATDTLGGESSALTASVDVVADKSPPSMSVVDPRLSTLYAGCAAQTALPLGPTVWAEAGCVRVNATDARSGVARVEAYVGGVLAGSDATAPYEFEVANAASGVVSLRIDVVDHAGNRASVMRTVVMAGA